MSPWGSGILLHLWFFPPPLHWVLTCVHLQFNTGGHPLLSLLCTLTARCSIGNSQWGRVRPIKPQQWICSPPPWLFYCVVVTKRTRLFPNRKCLCGTFSTCFLVTVDEILPVMRVSEPSGRQWFSQIRLGGSLFPGCLTARLQRSIPCT